MFESLEELESKAAIRKGKEEAVKAELDKEFYPVALDILKKGLKDLFDKYPKVEKIRWEAYVNKYNDETYDYESGDVRVKMEGVEYEDDADEEYEDENWIDHWDLDEPGTKQLSKDLIKFEDIIQSLDESFATMFGPNCQFTATRDRIEIEEADYDSED